MISTPKSSSITMPTASTTTHINAPSNSTGKSNHGNAPLPIQTANSPYELLDCRSISLTEFNNTNPQEDTNQAEASTTNTLNNVSTIAREEVCEFVINTGEHRICGQICTCKSALKIHERTHTKEKPYICTHCGKHLSSKQYLRIHERTHTGEKPCACNICNKAFLDRSNLQRHILSHTGEKNYYCEICNKSFARNSYLINHSRTHTGEKPYACHICNKAFLDHSNLRRHIISHTGEKNYYCEICDKSFTRNSSLINHSRIHTGITIPAISATK